MNKEQIEKLKSAANAIWKHLGVDDYGAEIEAIRGAITEVEALAWCEEHDAFVDRRTASGPGWFVSVRKENGLYEWSLYGGYGLPTLVEAVAMLKKAGAQ